MIHEKVYHLSKRFGPPNWDLQSAEIEDEWGDDKFAQRDTNHNRPEDVTKEDFLYYTQIYKWRLKMQYLLCLNLLRMEI